MSERRYVVIADQQIPWYDPELHDVLLRYLDETRPNGVILGGDITDKPQFSLKFPWNPLMVADPISSVREHQRLARRIITEYVEAAQSDENVIVPGNHDDRFIKYVIARAPLLMALEDVDGNGLISLESYLDAAGAGYSIATDPAGMTSYPAAHTVLGKHLAVYHGWLTPNGEGGSSAIAHLKYLQHSVIVAHTHRQAKVMRTLHPLQGQPTVLVGIEAGTTALIQGGLGHTVNPNWQQGIAEVTVFDNGEFVADPYVYANRTLFTPHGRWVYTRRGVRSP